MEIKACGDYIWDIICSEKRFGDTEVPREANEWVSLLLVLHSDEDQSWCS